MRFKRRQFRNGREGPNWRKFHRQSRRIGERRRRRNGAGRGGQLAGVAWDDAVMLRRTSGLRLAADRRPSPFQYRPVRQGVSQSLKGRPLNRRCVRQAAAAMREAERQHRHRIKCGDERLPSGNAQMLQHGSKRAGRLIFVKWFEAIHRRAEAKRAKGDRDLKIAPRRRGRWQCEAQLTRSVAKTDRVPKFLGQAPILRRSSPQTLQDSAQALHSAVSGYFSRSFWRAAQISTVALRRPEPAAN